MAILQWALTCTRVITDRDTNSVSYIDALEAFAVSHFPFPFPPVTVCTLWRRGTDKKEDLFVRVRIQDPSGKTIVSFEPGTPIVLEKKRHRLNVILGGAPIEGPGEYLITVEQRAGKGTNPWKREQVLPVDVSEIAVAEAQPVTAVSATNHRRRKSKAVRQRHAAGAASRRR